jgi:hypothetical protein
MPSLQHKRGTRTQLNAAATANGLKVGEVYFITGENRLAVGTAVNAFQDFAKTTETSAPTAAGITIPFNSGTPTAPPADNVTIFCREIANRAMPAFVGPSGLDTALQPLLARNKIAFWNPAGNATTAPASFGMGALTVASNGGTTLATRSVATTNILTRMKRVAVLSENNTGTVGSLRNPQAQYTTGDGAGLGGFHFICRFATSDATTVNGARAFIGFTSATNAPTNVQPSTLTNCVGIAQLSTDATQWYIVYGGSAAQTAIPLGTALGAPTLNNTAFELDLFSPPSSNGVIHYEAMNVGTGVKVIGTLTPTTVGVQTPASTTLLAERFWRTNNATGTQVGLDIISIYIETDQ